MAEKNLDPKEVRALAEEYKKDQGDYNNLLKDSIKYLNQMMGSYEKIQGKLQGLNKDTINLKTINKELEKSRQKQITEVNRLKDLEKELQKDGRTGVSNVNEYFKASKKLSELEKRKVDATLLGDTQKLANLNKILKYERDRQERLKSALTVDEVAYMTQLQTVDLAKKQIEYAQEQYETEQDVAKTIGLTGRLLGLMNKHLGVGKNLYGKIVTEAREGTNTTKTFVKIVSGLALGFAAAASGAQKLAMGGINKLQSGMKAMGGEEGTITKLTSNVTGLIKQIPFIGGLLGGIIDSFAMLLDFAVGAKSEFHMIGREIGLSANESMRLVGGLNSAATATGQASLNGKVLLRTYVDINKALEDTNRISTANAITAYQLQKFAGVELETVAQLEKLSRITGKNQSNIAGAVMSQVNSFKRLTGFGFSFQSILKEVASLSGYLGLQLAKYPGHMIKSLVAAKGLGLELKQLDQIADGFLDFESSITKQFEAQLLTGKEVNLNKARELFLNNQLLDAGIEITKQIGNSTEFLNMNRIAATAYAEQFGMTRDQMGDFLKQQEHLAAFGVGSTKELEKKVALMREQGRAQEAINMLGSEEAFNKYVTASATEDLSGFIEKIKVSLAQLVANTGLADMVQNFIGFLSKPENIMSLVNKIRSVFASIVGVIGTVIGGIMRAINGLAGSWVGEWMGMGDFRIDEGMINMVEGVGSMIRGSSAGMSAPTSIGGTIQSQNATNAMPNYQVLGTSQTGNNPAYVSVELMVDGQKMTKVVKKVDLQDASGKYDYNRLFR